jgi:hypothetical protein
VIVVNRSLVSLHKVRGWWPANGFDRNATVMDIAATCSKRKVPNIQQYVFDVRLIRV